MMNLLLHARAQVQYTLFYSQGMPLRSLRLFEAAHCSSDCVEVVVTTIGQGLYNYPENANIHDSFDSKFSLSSFDCSASGRAIMYISTRLTPYTLSLVLQLELSYFSILILVEQD